MASMVSILNSIILGLIINLSPLKKYSDKLIDASINQAYNSHVTVFGVTLVELRKYKSLITRGKRTI